MEHAHQVLVLTPSQDNRVVPVEIKASTEYGMLSLSLSSEVARIGGAFSGTMVADISKSLEASGVWVELLRVEKAGDKENMETYTVELQEQSSLTTGTTYRWPFSIPIPDELAPTINNLYTAVTWTVRGILAKKGFMAEAAGLISELGVGGTRNTAFLEVAKEVTVVTG